MKPGALLLLLGSLALWRGLPAAPTPRTSAQPPLSPSSAPGEAPQDEIPQEEEAKLACMVVAQDPQKSPLPRGKESGAQGEMEAEEPQPGKEAAGPAAPGKLLCKENPQLERPPVNNPEVESSGGPRPVEKPQEASEPPLGTQAQLGGAPVSREKRLLGGNATPKENPGRPKLAPKLALPSLETWNPVWDPSNAATSAGKTNSSEKQTSGTPGDKATPGMGKPSSREELVPASGHAIRDKPEPASAAGHLAHVGPTSGEKPAPNSGPEAHGRPLAGERPTSGEKPSSQEGHEKRPPADKLTPSEKPEDGAKPEAEKESKPEREAEGGKKMEEEEEEEEEEGEKGKENEEGAPEGNQDGEDAFDKELDDGLNNPPFDAYSYHDAWSDEGAKEAGLGLVGEMAAPPQAGDANNGGKPIFDAWGDLVGGPRP